MSLLPSIAIGGSNLEANPGRRAFMPDTIVPEGTPTGTPTG